MSEEPQTPHVDFGDVAAESVEESVEHERAITEPDQLAQPFAPADGEGEHAEHAGPPTGDTATDEVPADEVAAAESSVDPAPDEAPEPSAEEPPDVVNAITAAARR